MKYVTLAVLAMGMLATPALAETWSAQAKLEAGGCGDRAVANVTESQGTANLKFSVGGKQYAETNVKLAPDGSGRTEFAGAQGQTILHIAPGTGKRVMWTASIKGDCRWKWN